MGQYLEVIFVPVQAVQHSLVTIAEATINQVVIGTG
jgi:hypothetical protein